MWSCCNCNYCCCCCCLDMTKGESSVIIRWFTLLVVCLLMQTLLGVIGGPFYAKVGIIVAQGLLISLTSGRFFFRPIFCAPIRQRLTRRINSDTNHDDDDSDEHNDDNDEIIVNLSNDDVESNEIPESITSFRRNSETATTIYRREYSPVTSQTNDLSKNTDAITFSSNPKKGEVAPFLSLPTLKVDEGDVEEYDDEMDEDEALRSPLSSPQNSDVQVVGGGTRLHFLDNVKSFLTAIVVSHHASCAFGACGETGWFLIVGMNAPTNLSIFLKSFVTINQAYFMSLFFFISGYFVPSSYTKKGLDAFVVNKRLRLWIPGMLAMYGIVPATVAIAHATAGSRIPFVHTPGHAWYIFWLLLLSWVYISIQESAKKTSTTTLSSSATAITMTTTTPTAPNGGANHGLNERRNTQQQQRQQPEGDGRDATTMPPMPLPSTLSRIFYGSFICGILMLVVCIMSPGSFAFMPITIGSLTCDLLMFYAGILAKRHDWLERPLREQLDVHPLLLFLSVVLEATAIVGISTAIGLNDTTPPGLVVFFFMVAGIFCIEMSLLILLLFQEWCNFQTMITRFLSRSAYTVYIIHPIVVCGLTSILIQVYNQIIVIGNNNNDEPNNLTRISFENSTSILVVGNGGENGGGGAEDYFTIGWLLLNVCSHLIVWPLAYILTQLPVLRHLL